MDKKRFLLKLLSYLGFLTSAIFTYNLNADMANTTLEKVIAAAMTIVMQGGSFYFFIRALREKTKLKILYAFLAIMLFSMSIVATVAYQVADENKTANEQMTNSKEYRDAEKQKEIELENRQIAIQDKKELRQDIEKGGHMPPFCYGSFSYL